MTLRVWVSVGEALALRVPVALSVDDDDGVSDCVGDVVWEAEAEGDGVSVALRVCDCVGESVLLAVPVVDPLSVGVGVAVELADWVCDAVTL